MSSQEVGDIFGAGRGPAQAMLRSPIVLIVYVGLWGMNIFFFQLFGINYRYVLNYDIMKENKRKEQQDSLEDSSNNDPGIGTISLIGGSTSTTNNLDSPGKDKSDDDYDEDGGQNLPDSLLFNNAAEITSASAITWYKLVLFSLSLLMLLNAVTYIWIDKLNRGVVGAVVNFYLGVLVYVFLPIPANRWLRRAFYILVERTYALIRPRCWYCRTTDTNGKTIIPIPVPFVDVFYADAMCSFSKVFFDWGMLLHMASHYPDPVPAATHNILIPSAFAAVPFLIRARQCLLMYSIGKLKGDPKRYQHIANAIKYSTSIWPLMLSAYQKTLWDPKDREALQGLLILLQTTNALYSLFWDIVMDWGMMQNPQAVVAQACVSVAPGHSTVPMSCQNLILRPKLRYGWTISILILLADSMLRFSWTLSFFSSTLFVSHDAFVLCTQFLEVFRRAIWNLLRVEWENIKQKSKQLKARDSLSDIEDNDEQSDVIANINNPMEQEIVGLLGNKAIATN